MVTGSPITSRRAFLGALSGSLAATTGCLNRFRRTAERDEPSQVSVEILSLPDDEDSNMISMANYLADSLRTVGIDVDIIPRRHDTFLREILINQNYDMYVWRHPGQVDPDFLRPLLHSRFVEEPGWQNPFSFSSPVIDELLEQQRSQEGDARMDSVREIQEIFAEEYPFIPIAFEEDQRLSRPDRLNVREDLPVADASWILGLSLDEEALENDPICRLGTTDWRLTHNLNPLAVEYRDGNGVVELLYDPIERRWGDQYVPWLAERWAWTSPRQASAPTLEVRLRDGLEWQDGEPLTAEDVVFTYRFLADTTMTESDPVIPAPRFRGQTSIVDSVEAVDDVTVLVQFERSSRSVSRELLSLPILPEHIWENHTELTEVAGITISDSTTDALVIENLDPVGSGPFSVEDVDRDESLVLSRWEDHFCWQASFQSELSDDVTLPEFEELLISIRPSALNIADAIRDGIIDGSLRGLGREIVETDGDLNDQIVETTHLSHVGFNVTVSPFTGHAFRQAIAALIDRTFIVEEIYQDGARPALSPVYDEDFVPRSLQWTGPESSTFLGEVGSGELDEEAARQRFRDAGFQYSENGNLLSR